MGIFSIMEFSCFLNFFLSKIFSQTKSETKVSYTVLIKGAASIFEVRFGYQNPSFCYLLSSFIPPPTLLQPSKELNGAFRTLKNLF